MTRPLITRAMLRLSCSAFPPHPHPLHDACHELTHLLCLAEPLVFECAVEARRRGDGWGLAVTMPEYLIGETAEDLAVIEAAHDLGVFVGISTIDNLASLVSGDLASEVRGRLLMRPPRSCVHALARLDDQCAHITASADEGRLADARNSGWTSENAMAEFVGAARVEELLAHARALVLESVRRIGPPPARCVFVVTDRGSPSAAALGAWDAGWRVPGVFLALVPPDEMLHLALAPFNPEERRALEAKIRASLPPDTIRLVALHGDRVGLATLRLPAAFVQKGAPN